MEQNNYNENKQNRAMNSESQTPHQKNSYESFDDNYSTLESSGKIARQNHYRYSPSDYHREEMAPAMTMKDWFITYIVAMIPVVGMIMLFVWAFSNDTNPNRKNYCRAKLIVVGIWATSISAFWGIMWSIFASIVLSVQETSMLF